MKYQLDVQAISDNAQIIFGELFTPKLFRQQFCYFGDIDYTEEVSFLTGFEVSESEIKDFLTEIATKKNLMLQKAIRLSTFPYHLFKLNIYPFVCRDSQKMILFVI